ncbi:hypothetical protein [Streptomyces sp. NPDC002537]
MKAIFRSLWQRTRGEAEEDAAGTALYAQVVPQAGYVMPKVGGYEHVGARFRFRGGTTREVEKSILATADQFALECTEVE